MKFTPLPLQDAYMIDIEPFEDERGFFAPSWNGELFQQHGLNPTIVQCNTSFNRKKGTLRGMHFQKAPHQEAKLIRCTSGRIYDVMLDLRPDSPTYRQWQGIELSAENHRMCYIPEGFAHGFQTLEDNTEVLYQVSHAYHPESEGGVRWNDPAFQIQWPLEVTVISAKDQKIPFCELEITALK